MTAAEDRAIAPAPVPSEAGESGPLSEEEKQQLRNLQELIKRKLEQG